jgi:hypothetical protein
MKEKYFSSPAVVFVFQVEQLLPGAAAGDAVSVHPPRRVHAGLAQTQLALRPLQPTQQNLQCNFDFLLPITPNATVKIVESEIHCTYINGMDNVDFSLEYY